MRILLTIFLLTFSLQADGKKEVERQLLIAKIDMLMAQKAKLEASSSSETRTTQTYGTMKKPFKTVTIDLYRETTVDVKAKQMAYLKLLAAMKQYQEVDTKVDHKFKAVVR